MNTEEEKNDASEWDFLAIAPWMSNPSRRFKKHLEVGGQRLFKLFRLKPLPAILTSFFGLGILFALWILLKDEIMALFSRSLTVGQLLIAVLVLLLGFIPRVSRVVKVLRFLRKPSEFLVRLVIRGVLPAIGALFVNIHLWIFDPIFLRTGKIKRLGQPPK